MMPWLYLFVAGLFEVGWALGLKLSEGWTRPVASMATVVMMIATYVFLALAVRSIPLGTAYAIWAGVGVVGSAAIGIAWFAEPASWPRLVSIALILIGIVGLKLTTP